MKASALAHGILLPLSSTVKGLAQGPQAPARSLERFNGVVRRETQLHDLKQQCETGWTLMPSFVRHAEFT